MIIVLLALASTGSRVTFELKNDSVVVGTLDYVDKHMNCTLSDATESRQRPAEQRRKAGKSEMRAEGSASSSASSSSSSSAATMDLQTNRERPPLRLETMQVRGDSIRYVLPPRGFHARKEVHAWVEKEQRKGMTPKLY